MREVMENLGARASEEMDERSGEEASSKPDYWAETLARAGSRAGSGAGVAATTAAIMLSDASGPEKAFAAGAISVPAYHAGDFFGYAVGRGAGRGVGTALETAQDVKDYLTPGSE
jgi:hypothetical protein